MIATLDAGTEPSENSATLFRYIPDAPNLLVIVNNHSGVSDKDSNKGPLGKR
jgi:hypothetical protein